MLFWFKRKKVIVDWFTTDQAIHKFHSITKFGKDDYPGWWKRIPSTLENTIGNTSLKAKTSTIKKCEGLNRMFESAWIFPFWADVAISTNSEQGLVVSDAHGNPNGIVHPQQQFDIVDQPYFGSKKHFKFSSPWLATSKSKTYFSMIPATYHTMSLWSKMTILPGTLNFYYQNATNINVFVENNIEQFNVIAGTPMYYIVPQTEDDVEIKCHVTSPEEHRKITKLMNTFSNNYARSKKATINMESKNKCPFHFK